MKSTKHLSLMTMFSYGMRFFYIVFALIFSLCSFGSAQAELTIPGLANQSDPQETSRELPLAPLDPMNLTADWWHYFDVDLDKLDKRIDLARDTLNKLSLDASPNIKLQVADFLDSLQRYRELLKKPLPEPAPVLGVQASYTLAQWLAVVRNGQNLQVELQSEKEDLQSDEKRQASAQQHMDTLMAAYLDVSDQSPERLADGLGVMLAWVNQAVIGEKLRLKKAVLAVNEARLVQLKKQAKVARNLIAVSEQDIEQLKKDIKAAEQARVQTRTELTQLLAVVDVENINTDDGSARSLWLKQRISHASIKEAVADALLARKSMEYDLMQMLRSEDGSILSDLKLDLDSQRDIIQDLSSSLSAWQERAESDQERAGKSLATLFVSPEKQDSERVILTQKRLAEAQNSLLSLQRLRSEISDAKMIADLAQSLLSDKQGALATGVVNLKVSTVKFWEFLWDNVEASLFKIGETPVTLAGILRVLLIITFAWMMSHFVRRGLTHLSERQGESFTYLYTVGRLAHYLILIIGISIALSSIGVDLSNFALIAGALSLGVGFGLQAIVSNFVSGLIVLFERSLRIGDFVELSSGLAGEVKAINVRSTLVTTTDMVDILVPNSEFVNGQVINWTLTDASRRIHIPFGVAYGSDKDAVRTAALEAAHNTVHTVKNRSNREPEVWLTNFGDSSLDFELVVWVQPYAVKKPQRVRAAYYWELETALHKYGIEIPFPQRDLHIRSGLPSEASRTVSIEELPEN